MSPTDGRTTVYTDGACLGNPGPGGWAWAVPGGRWRSGAAAHTTNQRMEIAAALDAARSLEGPLEVVSDSTYVVNCFRDAWWEGWLARGWVGAAKQKVANRDLWEPLVELYRTAPGRLRFRWVKGHSTDPFNDLVDRLAVAAATSQHGSEGLQPPAGASLGPADVPTARPGRAGPSGGSGRPEDRTALRRAHRLEERAALRPAHRSEDRPEEGAAGPGGTTLRSGRDADVEAVLRLWQVAGAKPGVTDDASSVRLLMARDPMALIVAEVAAGSGGGVATGEPVGSGGGVVTGELVGTLVAGFDGWRANLHRLVVHPQWRRRGLGLALVEEAERRLLAQGAKRAGATVVLEDARALDFWGAAGYALQAGTRRHVKNLT
jgi:ribonuclease HI